MRVSEFVAVLRPYAAVIATYGDERLAQQIRNLAEAWKPAMSWSMKDLIGRAWPKEPLPQADEATVREFREALARLKDVVQTIGKQGFVTDLSALVEALAPHDREDLASFVKACQSALERVQTAKGKPKPSKKGAAAPIDEQRIGEIVRQLRESYKDPELFTPLYERLQGDQGLTKLDMAAIASHFAYETPPSTSRTESLRRIRVVHESYATSAAKSKSAAGKSAA